jgi:predicted DNA-binding transcriptional regulator AlpA
MQYQFNSDGLLRLKQVLPLVNVSRTTWLDGVRTGRYPQPIKIGARAVAWRASSIQTLIERGLEI